MAVTFVASSAVATGTNPTVSLPAGVVEKDLLLLITTGTATPTTPAGWTSRSAQGATGFITIFFKFATGTEAASLALTVTGTTTKAVMLAYRGASAIDTVSGFTTAAAATSLAPGLTGNAFANELEISIYAGNNAVGVWGAAPSPTTSRVSSDPTATVNGLLIVDETQAAAGNSTARTGTISTSHTLSSVAIAIIPSGRYWVGGTGTWTTTTTNWAFSSGGASGAPAPTANDPVTFDQAATYTVTLTGALTCFGMTVSAGTVTFSSTGTIANSGSMSLSSSTVWSATGLITFNSTSTGRTVTTNGVTINSPITFDGVAGAWSLGSALSTGVTLTTTLNNGTLTLNGFDLNTGSFSSSVATARSIAFGSNNIVLNQTTALATVLNMATATLFTYTGTGGFTATAAVAKTFVFGTTGGSATNAPNLTLTGSGTAVQTFTTASWFKNLSFGSTAYNPGTTALSIAGDLTLSAGGTFTALGVTMVGTGTITPNGKTIAAFTVNTAGTVTLAGALGATTYTHTAGTINFATFNLTCSGAASVAFGTLNNIGTISCTTWAQTGTFVLSSGTISASVSFTVTSGSFTYSGGTITTPSFVHTAGTVTTTIPWTMTTNSTYTLSAGTLTLGGNLTTGIFSSSGSGVRSIAFSTYNIILAHTTAGTTVLAASATTNYTQTSTGGGFVSDASITRTFTFGVTGSAAGQVPNLTLTGSGTAVQTITSGSNFNQLDFGTTAFTLPATSLFVNALILSSGGTFTNLSVTTANTTGGTITTNNRPIAAFQNGFSATQYGNSTLVGNLSCTTFVNNTLSTIDFGGYNVSCSSTFTHAGTNITNLGTITCTTFTINGPTFNFTSGTITPSVSFVLTSGSFTYGGTATLASVPTFTHTAGTVTFNQAYSLTTTGTYTLVAGTVTLAANLTTGSFITTGTGTRSIAFGTNQITLTGNNATIWDGGGAGITITGTMTVVSNYTGSVGTRTINVGTGWTESTDFDVKVASTTGISIGSSGTDIVAIAGVIGNLDLTGMTFTFAPGAMTVYGNYTIPATGGTVSASASVTTFGSTQVTPVVITISRTVDFPITFSGVGGTFNLGATLTTGSTRTMTLTAGTLVLNGNSVSTGIFSSTGTGTRAINFGGNFIALSSLTAATTVLSMADATNFTVSGAGGFNSIMAVAKTFVFGTTGGSATNAPNLFINAGSGIPTITTNSWFNTLDFTGSTSTPAATTVFVSTLTLATGGTYTALTPIFTRTQTWTTQFSKQLGGIGFNLAGGTLTLGDSPSLVATSTTTLTAGTLDLGGFDLTTGIFSSSNTNTRAIAFGSNNIILSHTTAAQTVLAMADATNFTVSGAGGFRSDLAVTRTFQFGSTAGGLATNAPNLAITSGAAVPTITTNSWFNALNFTGTTATPAAATIFVSTLTLATGGTYTAITPIFTRTQTWTTQFSKQLGGIGFNLAGGTLTLGDSPSLVATGTTTLTAGTLDLGGFNLTTGIFSSSNTNTRAIAFGSNNIVLSHTTAATTVLSMTDATNFTYTGTGGFTTDASITRTCVFGTTGGLRTNAPNLSLTGAGVAIVTLTSGSWFNNLSFGSTAFALAATTLNIDGNLTLSTGGTFTSLTLNMVGTGTITSNAKPILALTIDNVSGTTTLGDALTLGATAATTLTSGNLALNGFTLTTGTFSSSNTNTRSIAFGSSNIVLATTTAAAVNLGMAVANNFTYTTSGTFGSGTGCFQSTMSTTRTFQFGTTSGGSATNAPILYLVSGASIATLTTGSWYKEVNFGTTAFTIAATNLNLSNIYSPSSTSVLTALTATMVGTGSIQTNTTIGPLVINTSGITTTLVGATTLCTTAALTLGTLDLSNQTLTCSSTFTYNGGSLVFGTGTLNCTTFTLNGPTFNFTSGNLNPSTSFVLTTGALTVDGTATLGAVPTFTHTAGTATFNKSYGLTTTGTYTLASGSLTLGAGVILTTGIFSSSNTAIRSIGFGASISPASGSVLFDGTSQYLSTTGTTSGPLDLATGAPNWAVECWFNLADTTSDHAVFWKGGTTGTTNPSYAFWIQTGGVGQWIVGDGAGGGYVQNTSVTFSANTWYHFALVRNGSTLTAYINGVAQTPVTITTAIANTGNNALSIGSSAADGSTRYFAGNISNFRIVKGAAVYTGNFTPVGPLASSQNARVNVTVVKLAQTSLLLNTVNGANFITDSSSYAITLTNVGTATSSASYPFTYPLLSNINLTGTGTVLSMATLTGFTWSGPGGFQSDNASVGASTFTCGSTAGGSTTTAPNLTFSSAGGANVQTLTTASWFNNLNFGTTAFNPGTTALNITGSLTLSASGTYTTMTPTMLGTGNITSNGAVIAGLVINSTSGTTSLRSALATTATGTTTLTSGTLALNSFDLSTGIFSSSGTAARSVSFGTTSSAITGSAYFNGTNQYFSAASNTAYEFATGDFTVEAWINLTTTAAPWAGICQSDPFGTISTNNFEFYLADNPVGRLVFSDGFQTSQITIPFSPSANAWYHVAVTRQSGVMRMFVNGVSGTLTQSGTDPGTISWNQNGIVSGYNSSNGGYFPGYISNLRVVKGVAVYTGNFTLPSSPLAATQSSSTNISAITGTQTSLLLNTAYGVDFLADSSTYNSAITNNSAVTSSKTSPYRSNINLTHTTAATTVLSMATATGFTYTGTGGFVVPAMTNTRTFNVGATAGGSLTTAPNLTFTTGASVATLTTGSWFDNLDFGTTSFNPGTTALNITGDLTLSSTGTYTTMTPTMVGTGTITSNTNTTLAALIINSTSGTTSLGDAFSLSATGTTTLTSGTLAMNKFNLTTGIFSSSGAVTRSIAFGGSTAATSASFDGSTQYASYAINSNIQVTANQPFTVEFWIYTPTQVQTAPAVFGTSNNGGLTGDTAFFVGHSGLGIANQYGFYVAGLTNGIGGSGTTTNLLASTGNYIRNAWTHIALVRAGTDALAMYINGVLNATATYSGAINFPTNTLWVGTSGNNFPGSHYTGYISNFRWVTGVAVYTGNFAVPTSPLTATQSSGTNISAITGTQTSLLLNTVTGANILADSSSNNYTPTNVGGVAGIFYNPFAGVINLAHTTAATTVLNMGTATGFTLSGTGGFTATAAITRTYVFGTTGGSAAISPNLWLTGSGTAIATITTASWFNLLDFGSTAFTIAATALNLNALTLSTGGTFTNLTPTMVGTGTITTNGKTLPALTVNTAGTATLAGALTLSGALTLTQGTLASSTYPVTSATFASTGTATRSMTGSGTYTISGAGATAFSNASATGITITGLIISMTAATAKTFAGGGGSYSTLNQGGAGALTISGNNSFSDLTATTRPSTITFTAGSTQTFADFTLSGVLGSLVTINSSTAGTQASLSKSSGTVSVGYLSIRDSAAIGGAGWYAGTTSTNVSNNLGWVFTAPPAPGSVYLGNFFAFF